MGSDNPNDPATLAREIDEHYDSLLYDGMQDFELAWVEQQRAEEHGKLMQAALVGSRFRKL